VHRAVCVQNKNVFRDFRANLQTPARSPGSDERRTGPAAAGPRDDDTLAAFAAQAEADFNHGHDREPLRVTQDAAWNLVFRDVAKITQDPGGLIDDFLFGRGIRSERQNANGEQSADRFHGTISSLN